MRNLIHLIVLFIPHLLYPQLKDTVISSSKYYYGSAIAEQEQEARDRALINLSEQIAIKVSSFSERELVEKDGNIKDIYKNIIKTYAQSTLRNLSMTSQITSNGIEVFCYILKTDVGKIFDERKELVKNIYDKAALFEQEGNITDALKYYYFAIVLINSIPEKLVFHENKNLVVEIPTRINAIINSTRYFIVADRHISDRERELEIRIESLGDITRQVDISFWDGSSQVNVRASDGIGLFRLYGASASFEQLNIELKYSYYEARDEIAEVSELWDLVVKPSFKNSRKLSLRVDSNSVSLTLQTKTVKVHPELIITNKERTPIAAKIEKESIKLLKILNQNDPSVIRANYKYDKYLLKKILSMIKHNKIVSSAGIENAEINRTVTGWEVRQIPIICKYPTLHRQSTEYLIIDFTEKGELYDVNFGTLKSIYKQFVTQAILGEDWGNRQIIIKFMERYRTAYMTRDMEMLDSLFADEAVIIVGRELKKGKKKEDVQYSKLNSVQPDYSYTQYTKSEYLKNQKKVFLTQADIVLGFSTFKISRKNDSEGAYGISMKQNYTSTSYADEGHLFLLVDFQQEQPQIYVRSWQPREWNDNAIIKLSNFRINK